MSYTNYVTASQAVLKDLCLLHFSVFLTHIFDDGFFMLQFYIIIAVPPS